MITNIKNYKKNTLKDGFIGTLKNVAFKLWLCWDLRNLQSVSTFKKSSELSSI